VSNNPGGPRTDPSMRPTSISVLVVAALVAAAVGWLLLSFFYNDWPAPPWLPVIVIAALAVTEGILAQNTAARVQRKPGMPRVEPLAVARYAVLAKASSLAGALYGGYCAGLLAFYVFEPTKFARDSVPAVAGGVIASVALVAAALWLERACRVPDQPDREDEDDSGKTQRRI
jgi:ABC-type thiamin/hydroxymethylpyrimidine transport system permease subunit